MSMKKVYYANCNKVENSSRSGAGTDCVYDPKWPHFKAMSFLKETLDVDPMVSFFDVQENTYLDFFETSVSANSSAELMTTPKQPVSSNREDKMIRSCPPGPVPPPKRKKVQENLSDSALFEACKTLKQIQESNSKGNNKENNDDDGAAYGNLVKNRIRSLSPNDKPQFVRELQSLLNKYNM